MYMHNNRCHRATAYLQLNILLLFNFEYVNNSVLRFRLDILVPLYGKTVIRFFFFGGGVDLPITLCAQCRNLN